MATAEPETSEAKGAKAGIRALAAIAALLGGAAALVVLAPVQSYLWIKAVHVVSIIAWMAGLLYLPRLFVYHSDAAHGTPMSDTFAVMERRLLKVIMGPAMLVAWGTGLWLGWDAGWLRAGWDGLWLYAKIGLVIALTGSHIHFAGAQKRFERGEPTRPARYWRMVNEVPALLMVGIVVLVIVVKAL